MSRIRIIKDRIAESFTWLSSGISALVLIAIFVFIFKRGWSTLSWDLLTNNYNSENLMAAYDHIEWESYTDFSKPDSLPEGSYFSTKYGIAFSDSISAEKEQLMEVVYLDSESPLQDGKITTAGPRQGETFGLEKGLYLKKISFINLEGEKKSAGLTATQGKTSEELVTILDNQSQSVADFYAQTEGGGLRGSIITTLLLIGLTLIIALPIGVFAAIYLHELAPKNKVTAWLRSSIELLSGVPSVVFGLMGMTMLFNVTKLMGITGQSTMLGALTLAVILLPVIIRQTEEALINVPDGYRMASLSMGATQFQTIYKIIIPNALPGILSATLLSISRIIGESAALIFTMGTAITDNPAWNARGTSLAVHIFTVMSGEQPNFELASAISIVILFIVLILNISVKYLTYRMTRDKEDTKHKKTKAKVEAKA
ncbi:MAG: phosphate ABC transporter permease PstA [Clostridiaceae bacterium]|jgi:phosphate transport system permease protein|nr:phosphate ABC transporter permease PstA [Bacillota bacterium]NLN52518.1 phosphate ABC transporter permease PstA [Clostridiaceae bacterium]